MGQKLEKSITVNYKLDLQEPLVDLDGPENPQMRIDPVEFKALKYADLVTENEYREFELTEKMYDWLKVMPDEH